MKKKKVEVDDDLLPHYDFANMPIIERGLGHYLKSDAEQDDHFPEPKTELGKKLIAHAKRIRESGAKLLSIEEIEEHLGRKLGDIATKLKQHKTD
ncbi:MAG: hypothetical protein JNM09_20880 [Blastocatellia bacterium]|nr:hypothetical protein [Blastocatellia bacterium]